MLMPILSLLHPCLAMHAAGWNQFDLDFFVSAPKTAAIDGSHHRMVVFDTRLVPGDTAAFPAVRPQP